MSYREARDFFELDELYTKKELDKSYQKLLKEKPITSLGDMYSILLNELNKRIIKEQISILKENINNLKEKYANTKIVYLCNSFDAKLKYITSPEQLDKVKGEFNEKVSFLKQQIIVPREKINIIENVKTNLKGASLNLKKIVSDYIDKITTCNTLEEINSIKQKYDKLLSVELRNEKLLEQELINLKNSLKKSEIYNFYQETKQLNINDIINAHKLLINILNLSNMIDFDNRDYICKLINEVNYQDIGNSLNKINLYLKSNNINTDNFDNKLVTLNDSGVNHIYLDLVLDKYYLYATKKKETVEKLVNDKEYFLELFKLINETDEKDLKKLILYLNNISYKNMKVVIEAFHDFKDPKNIYIERKTGQLCVFKNTSKKIYTVFLNGEIKKDIVSSNDIIWKYLSLLKFFNLAFYSEGYEINEVSANNKVALSDYNTNYLYYTNELLLCLVDDGKKKYFKFLTNYDDFKFVKGDNTQITRNSYFDYYKDKNKCLSDLVLNINNLNNIELENKKSL